MYNPVVRHLYNLGSDHPEKSSTHLTPYRGITILLFRRSCLFIFRERGREGERRRKTSMCERNIDQFCNMHVPWLGIKWQLNWWPFAWRDEAQPTEPCWSGLLQYYWLYSLCCTLYPHDCSVIYQFVLLNPFTFSTYSSSKPFPSGNHQNALWVCFWSACSCVLLCFVFRFHI